MSTQTVKNHLTGMFRALDIEGDGSRVLLAKAEWDRQHPQPRVFDLRREEI